MNLHSLADLPLDDCLSRDRGRFIGRLRKLRERQQQGKPVDQGADKLLADLAVSRDAVAARRALVPEIHYPDDLPIVASREEISATIAANQVVVIAGETGSGKTTQLPKICLALGRGCRGLIGHTQPRRIAARSVAARIAEELATPLGKGVGYQIRFADHTGPETLVKLMTDGILLAEIQHDPLLSKYDTLIVDEAHERSLNIDFLLGYLKKILPRRPDLKLIITSATIDVEKFSRHFDHAPVINVSGRTYPVALRYRPAQSDEDYYGAIVDAVEELLAEPKRGDILVFLSGEREIREAATALRRASFPHLEVLPLYGRLSLADQTRVFQPHRGTRVVLATNVAGTSITVPGIRYVVDTGLARISRYSYRTKVQRLPIEPISRASANQRAGRCGRLGEGVCIRLYSEEDFNGRPEFTDPEIVRTNLAAVILQMLSMRIGDIRDFPFVDMPENKLINDGFQLLAELQAVDGGDRLNPCGRALSRLPLDPRLGKMLVTASDTGALREALVVVAMLSLQDPRERPADKRQAADEKHRQWRDQESDFSTILLIWDHFEEKRQELSRRKFADYCHDNFISYLRMREWRDLHHQLHLACRELGLKERRQPAGYDALHRALLSGLLSHVGFRHEDKEFLGVRNRKFLVFPGSGLAKKPPKWLVAGELIETARLFAHNVARIEPEWIPPLAMHLIRKNHSEPYYDARRGQVMAFERQTLFGLTIVERKRVPFSAIDPDTAREIFIRGALVEDRYRGKGDFAGHNRALLAELNELEDRLRQRGIAVDDDYLYAFYDSRIPEDITTLRDFDKWRKKAESGDPRLLFLDRQTLLARSRVDQAEAQFPKVLEWKGISYPVAYRFAPGDEDDGVTVTVAVANLHEAPDYLFDWLVPGLLRDKCVALVKTLTKHYRKQLVPVPDHVDRAMTDLRADNKPLAEALGHQLKRHSGVEVPADAWQVEQIDDFYRATFRLVDERGRVLATGKDLRALKQQYRRRVQATIEEVAGDTAEIRDISDWSFGRLKESQRIRKGKLDVEVFPALVDEGGDVALKLLDSREDAAEESVRGVVRLLMRQYPDAAKYLRKQLFKGSELAIVAAGLEDHARLIEDIIFSAYHSACLAGRELPRSKEAFAAALAGGSAAIVGEAQNQERVIIDLLPALKAVRRLRDRFEKRFSRSMADIDYQLAYLFRPEFLFKTDGFWRQQYPRYLKALEMRMEKLPGQADRDEQFCREAEHFLEELQALVKRDRDTGCRFRGDMETFRFLLEEYRVSVFAQVLKTVRPVSAKRLRAYLDELRTRLAGG